MGDSMRILGADHRTRSNQPFRVTVCVLAFAILTGALLYQGLFPGGLVVVVPLGGVPLLGYVAWVRSQPGSIAAGLALILVCGGTALYVTERIEAGSSTAPVGYLYLLVAGLPALLVTLILERLLEKPAQRPSG
jgi:hypothetical protein